MVQYSKAIQDIIKRSEGSNTHSQRLNALQRRVHDATLSLEKVAAHRDPTLPIEAHKMKVAKATQKLQKMLDKERQAVEDFRYTAMGDLYKQIETRANLVPDPMYSSAILNRFAGMRSKDQVAFLNDLLAEGDGPSLAAILLAPKAATGLSKEHSDRIYEAYTKAAAPEASAALLEYGEIENATSQTITAATRAATEMNDPDEVDRIIAEQQKSYDAERLLDQSTGSYLGIAAQK